MRIIKIKVINAALTLAARNDSAVAQENMEAFRRKWENEVQNLTDSVDEIVTIHDFLAVSEAHILEDVTQCVGALQVSLRWPLFSLVILKILFLSADVCNVLPEV